MDTNQSCPVCGKPVIAGAPHALCPECLMKAGFETRTGNEAAAGRQAFVPPSVEEVAKLFPQLEILALLGQGGMGAVYKARQPRLDRLVALKILSPEKQDDPQFAERFEREGRALASLTHPNIVAVHDFGETGGKYYLLMEFVDGQPLRQVYQTGRLLPAEALAIVPQICAALQYAHEHGIVHRDIKPENILLDKNGRVKIADFGIAKIIDPDPRDLSLTGARDVVGTPLYMAPEQIEKPQTVDGRADIYSLGVVFYEMLTGELPLGKFQPPSQKAPLDARLDAVVLHALEKEPAMRYQKAGEVKTAVEKIAATPGARATSAVAGPGAPTGKSNWLAPALIFLALAACVVGAVICVVVWMLAVKSPKPKVLVRGGPVALWSGEGNGNDSVGTNNAVLKDVTFAEGKKGQAFVLNGRTAYATVAASPSLDMEHTKGLTILLWMKPADVNGFHPIIEWNSIMDLPHGIGCQLRLARHPDEKGELVGVLVGMDGRYHALKTPEGAVVTNRWQQAALTYDRASGTGVLYLNGQAVSEARWRSFPLKTKGDLWISSRPEAGPKSFTYDTFFSGLLDEIAIYNRALSADEVRSNYNGNVLLEEVEKRSDAPVDDSVWLKLDRRSYERYRAALAKAPPALIVRPTHFSLAKNPGIGMGWGWIDGKIVALSVSFSELVSYGYSDNGTWDERLMTCTEFPAEWRNGHLTNRFDVILTRRDEPRTTVQEEVRKVLRQDFGLAWHRETRDTEMLAVRIKDPHPLEAAVSAVPSESRSIAEMVKDWENYFGKPVRDETGATKRYDRNMGSIPAAYIANRTTNLEANNQFLEQYGLELVPTNQPMEWLVMERVGKAKNSADAGM